MPDRKEILRWSPVGILLALALVAPLFGDSSTAVVIPLLLAGLLSIVIGTQAKRSRAGREH